MILFLLLCCTAAVAKEAGTDQASPQGDAKSIGGGRPVTTITVKACPRDGYELVVRANGQRGCAKAIVAANEQPDREGSGSRRERGASTGRPAPSRGNLLPTLL
jgi:hypothetical protein